MTDLTNDTGATVDADDLTLVQGLADESADREDLWAEFDEAEGTAVMSPEEGAAADGFTVDVDGADGPATSDDQPGTADHAAEATDVAPDLDWAGVPETHRVAFERMADENKRLSNRVKSDDGRVAAYQRRYEDLLKAAQPRTTPGDRPTPDAAIAAIKQDYPEIAEPLAQAFGAIQGDVATLSEAEEGRRMAAETELSDFLDAQERTLTAQHPDYLDVLSKNADRLVAWVDDQPRAVREAFARNADKIVDAAEAATVISAFKDFLAPPAAAPSRTLSDKRQRQLGAAASPGRSTRRPTSSGIPEEGDPEVIWAAFDAQEAAAR